MRRTILRTLLLAAFCLVLSKGAEAQSVIGYSETVFDDFTNTVYGYSVSELDYYGGFHYRAYVEGYLYDEGGNLLDSGYSSSYFVAMVITHAPARPWTEYTVFSDHYLIVYYYTTVVIRDCDPYSYYWWDRWDYFYYDDYWGYYDCYDYYWWDPWGFGFLPGGYYGSWWYWYGYGPPANLETEYIYQGSTSDSLITPPDTCEFLSVYDTPVEYYAASYSESATTCSIRPYIKGQKELWYFNGVTNPPNYSTEITLTANPGGHGNYQWRIISGFDKALFQGGAVALTTGGNNTVTLYSIAPSDSVGDVSLFVTVDGVRSSVYKVTVRAPHTLQRTAANTDTATTAGYSTQVHYQVNQKIGNAKMPFDTDINEYFPGNFYDFVPNNWFFNCPNGITAPSAYFNDTISWTDPGGTLSPAVCAPGACPEVLVDGIDQEWRAGSTQTGIPSSGGKFRSGCTTGNALGRRVQTDILNRFTDRGDHANITTPAP